MDERNRWILHIKELRGRHDVSINEAERLALTDPTWRRWVEHQINSDADCRRMALRHIRYNGGTSLLGQDGERLFVR
jgi:choline dehydrogenase-like flavoprotein